MKRWQQGAQDVNEKPVISLSDHRELEKRRAQDQKEINVKRLQLKLRRSAKALAGSVALLMAANKIQALRHRAQVYAHRHKAVFSALERSIHC